MKEEIFCGLCGQPEGVSLFRHLREVHSLAPEAYQARCPNAPLFTPGFGDYLRQGRLRVEDGRVVAQHRLFGVEVKRGVVLNSHVPVLDEKHAFDPELARGVLLSLLANDRILLVGPTGSGKSSLIAQLAARLNWPLRKINLHGETGVSDFLGQHKARNGEVYYQYGLLPTAMREGQILVLEELDAATPEILFALQGVLEEEGTLTLADNGGEVITPHPDFRLVATANTLGTGDETSLYAGTQVLNASHLDRWQTVFAVDYLGASEEAKVIRDKAPGLSEELADGMLRLALAVRQAVAEEQLYTTFSTRRLLALARKTASLGLSQALAVTVLNKLSKNERTVVAELAQRHLPGLEKAALESAGSLGTGPAATGNRLPVQPIQNRQGGRNIRLGGHGLEARLGVIGGQGLHAYFGHQLVHADAARLGRSLQPRCHIFRKTDGKSAHKNCSRYSEGVSIFKPGQHNSPRRKSLRL